MEVLEQIAEYLKKEILSALPARVDQLSGDNIEALYNKLHALLYYCIQKGIEPYLTDKIKSLMESVRGFWELLEDNANTFSALKETYKMRRIDLASNLMGQFEEIISGEEDLRDVIMTSFATFLAWKADTIWVDMAEKERVIISKTHTMRLKDEIWQFIRESSQNGGELTLEKAAEIGEKMELLIRFITSDDIPALACIIFISQVYLLLLKLCIGRILMDLTAKTQKTEENTL